MMATRRQRERALPHYPDSSRLWHYHLLCRHCHPYGLTSDYVMATRRDVFRLQQELNDSILFPVHKYVVIGCALPACVPQTLSED